MNDAREQERLERQYRRLKRRWDSLPPEKQMLPTEAETAVLRAEGLVDEFGDLTPVGELRLHQLETLEWMMKHPPEERRQRKLEQKRNRIASSASALSAEELKCLVETMEDRPRSSR